MLGLDLLHKYIVKIYDGLIAGIFSIKTSITSVTITGGSFSTATMINKNGTQTQVTLDTAIPGNTVPMPVEIVSTIGTPATFNITTGDIAVHTQHKDTLSGVTYDSIRIGDGVTELSIIPTLGAAKVGIYGNTVKDGSGTFYTPLVDTDGQLQVDVLTVPAITGTVTANAGTNLNTSALAIETGGNLATVKTNTDRPTTVTSIANTSIGVTATQITSSSLVCKKVIFACPDTNTKKISVGGSGVTLGFGITLYPGDTSDAYDCTNVNIWYAIAEVANEDIGVTYLN